MTLGFVMLVHDRLDRAGAFARHLAGAGCPVVIHVDRDVPRRAAAAFLADLSDVPEVSFSKRRHCEWGTWSIVEATRDAARMLLDRHRAVRHVCLVSGACLPLRSVTDLRDFLADDPSVDYIESVTSRDVPWVRGGLDQERFDFTFPFAWKKQRSLFDAWTRLQRRLGRRRRIPEGLKPHLGSQWWCLTRRTLTAILDDPNGKAIDRYFRRTWIPDESYFQTMVRRHARRVESRSLTMAAFDAQGRPHLLYDDHLELLRHSDAWFARKVWAGAEGLYRHFLSDDVPVQARPDPARIERHFRSAHARRVTGRPGLVMQSRAPKDERIGEAVVFWGVDAVFENFAEWAASRIRGTVNGHLFAPDRAEFANAGRLIAGCLSDSARIRDRNPDAFLSNLMWNTRGDRQAFMMGPEDRQAITDRLVRDPALEIFCVTGTWAIGLAAAAGDFAQIRRRAAELQRIEASFVERLNAFAPRARMMRLSDLLNDLPDAIRDLEQMLDPGRAPGPLELPRIRSIDRLPEFVRRLKNDGMNPYLVGEIPTLGRPGKISDISAVAV